MQHRSSAPRLRSRLTSRIQCCTRRRPTPARRFSSSVTVFTTDFAVESKRTKSDLTFDAVFNMSVMCLLCGSGCAFGEVAFVFASFAWYQQLRSSSINLSVEMAFVVVGASLPSDARRFKAAAAIARESLGDLRPRFRKVLGLDVRQSTHEHRL